ncbi:hypothetical protein F5Y18DRAFT_295061 [Xylariaceae sp. FL1019]|nr:hypothetical protein F5Y18DRAFT_295061 [Xylariaceae sp. FL1019]
MGQRHQVYVIAKIGNRFRGLAALHHQWRYGDFAVKHCARLVKTFQEQKNHPLSRYELQLAAALPEEKWEEKAINNRDERALFPFIATCLMLGSSFDPSSGPCSNVIPLPFNTSCGTPGNNDGVTILDITDLSAVRYAFIFPDEPFVKSNAVAFRCTPLTGAEYASFYLPSFEGEDEEGDQRRVAELLRSNKIIDTALQSSSSSPVMARLIDDKTLASAWPGTWRSRADCGLPVDSEIYNPPSENTTPVNSTALQEQYEAFQRADEVSAWDYVEEFRKYPPMPIKQIIHVATNEDTDNEDILRLSTTNLEHSMGLSLATLPLDDTRLSAAATLQGLYTWIHSESSNPYGCMDSLEFSQFGSLGPQDLLKSFGLDGPDFTVIKPVPAAAFQRARDRYHSSINWLATQIADIKPCEWIIMVHERCEKWAPRIPRTDGEGPGPLPKRQMIEIGFVTRRESGDLAVASAKEFHEELGSKGPNGEPLAWSNDEGFYCKELIEVLEREDGKIGEIPITTMGIDRVRCIVDACVAREAWEKEEYSRNYPWKVQRRADNRRRAERMKTAQASEEASTLGETPGP